MDTLMADDDLSSPFPELPPEINVHILMYLDLQTMVRTRRVSRAFAQFSKVYLGPGLICKLNWSTPHGRASHSAVVHGDEMYIYGGDEGSALINRPNNHLIRFHLRTHKYQHIKYPGLPVMTEHSCVQYQNALYLFAGFCRAEGDTTTTYSDAMFRIRLGVPEGEKAADRVKFSSSTALPKVRSAHSAVVHRDTMYVYGGWFGRNSDTHNDFWAFHFPTSTWQQIPNLVVPPMRAHASCVYKDSVYIFGGYCEAMKPNEFNKLYRFDIPTKTWTAVQTKGTVPEGRSRCSMVAAQDCLYVFGGWNRTHSFSDLFQFDIASSTWNRIKLRDEHLIEGGIQHHSCIVYHNFLLIYGGTVNGRLNEQLFVIPI